MSEINLESVAKSVPSLKAIFVTAMPDCLLYKSWLRDHVDWSVEEAASFFGDLVRANRGALATLGSASADMQVTIESTSSLIILLELSEDFVLSTVFDRDAPLGMVRLHSRKLVDYLKAALPKYEILERPRGVRVIEFLQRYSPDPHTVLLRTALRTELTVAQLEKPEDLNTAEVARVEEAVCNILGLDSLNL